MEINLKEVTIAELYNGYEYDELSDILGYGGKLNIRPAFQREFIYKERDAKIPAERNVLER